MEKTKILFVCLGNICRSPGAEAVMKHVVEQEGADHLFEIDSAGTSGYHDGDRADSRMRRHGKSRGYDLTSISRRVMPARDFQYFDMIIGMDDSNMSNLHAMITKEEHRAKLHKLTDFRIDMDYDYVPDPYYGDDADFHLVIDLLEDSCRGLFNYVMKKNSAIQ